MQLSSPLARVIRHRSLPCLCPGYSHRHRSSCTVAMGRKQPGHHLLCPGPWHLTGSTHVATVTNTFTFLQMKVLSSVQSLSLEISIDTIINEIQNTSLVSVFLRVCMSVCVWWGVCMPRQGLITLTPVYSCCLERKQDQNGKGSALQGSAHFIQMYRPRILKNSHRRVILLDSRETISTCFPR